MPLSLARRQVERGKAGYVAERFRPAFLQRPVDVRRRRAEGAFERGIKAVQRSSLPDVQALAFGPVLSPSVESQPKSSDAGFRGIAELRTAGDVEMGYGHCQLCSCAAYVEPYDGTQLCVTCKHNYSAHW